MSPFMPGHKGFKKKNESEVEKIEVPAQFSNDPQEIKEEVKQEVKESPSPSEKSGPQTFVVKTELDAYINELLINQPKSIDEIKVKTIDDDVAAAHILVLPKEIEKELKNKNMVPRWINKKKRAIDHAINQRGWTIFNRSIFPKISKHNFTANGTVEVGDCILGFMPASNAELLRKRPGQISSERIKNLPIEAYKNSKGEEKIGYYKPAYTAEPDGEMARREAGLFAQPDTENVNDN